MKGNCEGFKVSTVNIQRMIDDGMKLSPPDEAFKAAMQPWYDQNISRAEETFNQGQQAHNLFIETAILFGEDNESLKKKTSADFFKDLNAFLTKNMAFLEREKQKRKREAAKK